MNDKDLISVIVPIYNAELTIKRCVESIINQSYKNIEIILVNDGSTDSSKEICEEIIDERITLINQNNMGVSHTRNTGIKHATGKYICFIDSDDYLEFNHIQNMYDCMIQYETDLVIVNFYQIIDSGISKNRHVKNYESCHILDCIYDIYTNSLLNPPWNKLYKHEKILKMFDESLSLGEDLIFNIDYILNIQRISVINNYTYYYDLVNGNLHKKQQSIEEFFYLYGYIYDNIINVYNKKMPKFNFFVLKHFIRFLYEQGHNINYQNYLCLKSFFKRYDVHSYILVYYVLSILYLLTRRDAK